MKVNEKSCLDTMKRWKMNIQEQIQSEQFKLVNGMRKAQDITMDGLKKMLFSADGITRGA
uniref:hypothetical protein n=1 Tax=Clostridium sp. NkU-1 TaxID=1095009 RepID=UPI00326173D3